MRHNYANRSYKLITTFTVFLHLELVAETLVYIYFVFTA